MTTFRKIVRASAAALALSAVPMLASAATPADAQVTTHHQRSCDCKSMRHAQGARDAQARDASKERAADQEFVQRVWAAP